MLNVMLEQNKKPLHRRSENMKTINRKKWIYILPLLVFALTFAFATPALAQDGAGWRTAHSRSG